MAGQICKNFPKKSHWFDRKQDWAIYFNFCGLQIFSSLRTLAPHFLHSNFGLSLSSKSFFSHAFFTIVNQSCSR